MWLRSGKETNRNGEEMIFKFKFPKKKNITKAATTTSGEKTTTSETGNTEVHIQEREMKQKLLAVCSAILHKIPSVLGVIGGLYALYQIYYKGDSNVNDGDIVYLIKKQ